jgi:transcriptional regulator with XRE-family HTH domain/tetratricopeptide (TPR) repeat protein
MHEPRRVPNWRLRAAREKRLWTIEQACERVGASRNAYYRWERGLQYPNMSSLTRLHEVFGLSPEELGFTRHTPAPGETTGTTPMMQSVSDQPSGEQLEAATKETHPSLCLCTQVNHAETTGVGYAAGLCLRQEHLIEVTKRWDGPSRGYDELEAIIDQEIDMFDAMKPHEITQDYTVSRRQALIAIAVLPMALLTGVHQRPESALLIGEFLSRCAASIAACRHLMNGRELGAVGQVLPQYLPTLVTLAQRPSPHQQAAAKLAIQAYQLQSILALHQNNLTAVEAFCQEAITYSRLTGDHNQYVTALLWLVRYAYFQRKRSEKVLETYQEVMPSLHEIPPLQRSAVHMTLSWAYARSKEEQEALRHVNLAHEAFTAHSEDGSNTLDIDLPWLYLWEGFTHLVLHQHYPDSGHHQKAWETFAYIEGLQPKANIPERTWLEIINYQAQTALALRNLELFCSYLEQGANGAKLLGSEKRRQEAIDAYRQGRSVWPNEARVRDLADLLLN